jgi:hypothetical protein
MATKRETVWVVTSEVNQYDQYGEYLLSVFANKPTMKELCLLGIGKSVAAHLLETGGGRVGVEDVWYYLEEVNFGELSKRYMY